jgi:hypothetical protein
MERDGREGRGEINCTEKTALKGTVARDFLASVFFMDLLHMRLRFRG